MELVLERIAQRAVDQAVLLDAGKARKAGAGDRSGEVRAVRVVHENVGIRQRIADEVLDSLGKLCICGHHGPDPRPVAFFWQGVEIGMQVLLYCIHN